MQFVNAHVRQITNAADTLRQPREQLRLLQKRDIRSRPRHAVGHIHNLATLLVDCDLRNPATTREMVPGAKRGLIELLQGDIDLRLARALA